MPKLDKNLSTTIDFTELYRGDVADDSYEVPEIVSRLKDQLATKPVDFFNKIYPLAINYNGKLGEFYVDGSPLVLGKIQFTGVIAAIDHTCQIKSVEITDEDGKKYKEYRTIPMLVVWLRLSQEIPTEHKTFVVGEIVPLFLRNTLLGKRGALAEFLTKFKNSVSSVSNPLSAITMLWTFGGVAKSNDKGSWFQIEASVNLISPQTLTSDERAVMRKNVEAFAAIPGAVSFDPIEAVKFAQLPHFVEQAMTQAIYPSIHPDDFQRISTNKGLIDPEGCDIRVSPIVEALMGSSNKALPAAEELTAEEAKASIGM
jgi:hypothetical protein